MAKIDIEKKLKEAREKVKNDLDFSLMPLNTEEDMRRALRVVLTSLIDLYETMDDVTKALKKLNKENTP